MKLMMTIIIRSAPKIISPGGSSCGLLRISKLKARIVIYIIRPPVAMEKKLVNTVRVPHASRPFKKINRKGIMSNSNKGRLVSKIILFVTISDEINAKTVFNIINNQLDFFISHTSLKIQRILSALVALIKKLSYLKHPIYMILYLQTLKLLY